MIMFRLVQDKSLTVKLFWRVDPKISMTSRVLWVFQNFLNLASNLSRVSISSCISAPKQSCELFLLEFLSWVRSDRLQM